MPATVDFNRPDSAKGVGGELAADTLALVDRFRDFLTLVAAQQIVTRRGRTEVAA